jgi:hypothetical protein
LRALHIQCYGRHFGQLGCQGRTAHVRHGERSDRQNAFPAHLERFSAGVQYFQLWRAHQEPGKHDTCSENLFEVVEDQQHLSASEKHHDLRLERLPYLFRDVERSCDGVQDQLGLTHGGKINEVDTVAEGGHRLGRRSERESRFTSSTRPSERQ